MRDRLWYWVLWETRLYPTGKSLASLNQLESLCVSPQSNSLHLIDILFIGVFWLPLFIFNRVLVNTQWSTVLRCCLMNRANEEPKVSCGSFLIRPPPSPQSFFSHFLILVTTGWFCSHLHFSDWVRWLWSDTALTPQPPLTILALTITLGSHQPLMEAGPQFDRHKTKDAFFLLTFARFSVMGTSGPCGALSGCWGLTAKAGSPERHPCVLC